MPHTNRKKKPSSSKPKPTIVHTKRQEILDDEGWTHVVDTPRKRSATLTKSANGGLYAGDFEIDGVGYVERTVEEMRKECEFWRKGWEESAARGRLGKLLREEVDADVEEVEEEEEVEGEEDDVMREEEKESADTGVNGAKVLDSNADASKEMNETKDKSTETAAESIVEDLVVEKETAIITEPVTEKENPPTTEQSTPENETAPTTQPSLSQRRKVDNIIVLGLGSLQSARREGRRATLTQLAALQTIIQHLESEPTATNPLKIILQEPLFTPLDKTYLTSLPNFEIVNDPEAFAKITEGSLVYAIHCYAQVYKCVSEGVRPAVLVGTDVGNFGRFNLSESADAIQAQLEELVSDCEVLDFPQVRHDFSDTKIYWRRDEVVLDSLDPSSINP